MDTKVLKNNAKLVQILETKDPGYILIIDAEEKVLERHGSYIPSLLYICSGQMGAPKHCLGTSVLPLKGQC